MNTVSQPAPTTDVSLFQFVGYFLWLGTVGFGGPIALAGHMQQDLVDERGWVSQQDYIEGLALAQLAPGPLAAQLAMYLGYVKAGVLGATAVGIAFVLPSFVMVVALSAAYVRYGGLRWMQEIFYGVGAAVIGIITRSTFKLTKLTLGKDKLLWGIFAVLAVSTAWTSREIIWLFLLGGVVAVIFKAFPLSHPQSAMLGLFVSPALLPTSGPLSELFFYFAKAGLFVFGSGLAVVPFLYGGVVQGHHWLTEHQFVDAVAVAMITPGPVVITVAFIGYLVAGIGSDCRRTRHICPGLLRRYRSRAVVQTMGEEFAVECFRARSYSSSDGSYRGRRSGSRTTFAQRRSNDRHRGC